MQISATKRILYPKQWTILSEMIQIYTHGPLVCTTGNLGNIYHRLFMHNLEEREKTRLLVSAVHTRNILPKIALLHQ